MIKELRCDNGKECMNARVFQFAKEKGIIIKPCPAYVHQINGTAERYNCTLMNMGKCLLSEAKMFDEVAVAVCDDKAAVVVCDEDDAICAISIVGAICGEDGPACD
ncbi:unnamed protein product [Colias eurytheme]|nr:unnamed protein product [Colias eurytheme]